MHKLQWLRITGGGAPFSSSPSVGFFVFRQYVVRWWKKNFHLSFAFYCSLQQKVNKEALEKMKKNSKRKKKIFYEEDDRCVSFHVILCSLQLSTKFQNVQTSSRELQRYLENNSQTIHPKGESGLFSLLTDSFSWVQCGDQRDLANPTLNKCMCIMKNGWKFSIISSEL